MSFSHSPTDSPTPDSDEKIIDTVGYCLTVSQRISASINCIGEVCSEMPSQAIWPHFVWLAEYSLRGEDEVFEDGARWFYGSTLGLAILGLLEYFLRQRYLRESTTNLFDKLTQAQGFVDLTSRGYSILGVLIGNIYTWIHHKHIDDESTLLMIRLLTLLPVGALLLSYPHCKARLQRYCFSHSSQQSSMPLLKHLYRRQFFLPLLESLSQRKLNMTPQQLEAGKYIIQRHHANGNGSWRAVFSKVLETSGNASILFFIITALIKFDNPLPWYLGIGLVFSLLGLLDGYIEQFTGHNRARAMTTHSPMRSRSASRRALGDDTKSGSSNDSLPLSEAQEEYSWKAFLAKLFFMFNDGLCNNVAIPLLVFLDIFALSIGTIETDQYLRDFGGLGAFIEFNLADPVRTALTISLLVLGFSLIFPSVWRYNRRMTYGGHAFLERNGEGVNIDVVDDVEMSPTPSMPHS
jgi:hypothetical protein